MVNHSSHVPVQCLDIVPVRMVGAISGGALRITVRIGLGSSHRSKKVPHGTNLGAISAFVN